MKKVIKGTVTISLKDLRELEAEIEILDNHIKRLEENNERLDRIINSAEVRDVLHKSSK